MTRFYSDFSSVFPSPHVFLSAIKPQFIGGIKRTIFEGETKADFETHFVKHIKAATGRMLHSKKLIKELRPDLVKFHEKVKLDKTRIYSMIALQILHATIDPTARLDPPSLNQLS